MIVADLTITERRERVVDFSVPYMFYTEEMLLKKTSSSQSSDLLQFMNPFDNNVWFAILGSQFVISIAVFVLNYYSPYGYKDGNGRGTSQEFSFFNSLWFSLACMLQQGADNSPRSLSGRETRMNELPVIGYPCMPKELCDLQRQTLQVATRKCMAKNCFYVQKKDFGERFLFRRYFIANHWAMLIWGKCN